MHQLVYPLRDICVSKIYRVCENDCTARPWLGDLSPPCVALLFAHQSADGGENALVDARFTLEEMAQPGAPSHRR
jgi:hypothetical protein